MTSDITSDITSIWYLTSDIWHMANSDIIHIFTTSGGKCYIFISSDLFTTETGWSAGAWLVTRLHRGESQKITKKISLNPFHNTMYPGGVSWTLVSACSRIRGQRRWTPVTPGAGHGHGLGLLLCWLLWCLQLCCKCWGFAYSFGQKGMSSVRLVCQVYFITAIIKNKYFNLIFQVTLHFLWQIYHVVFTIHFLYNSSQIKVISDIPIPQPRKKKAENNWYSRQGQALTWITQK